MPRFEWCEKMLAKVLSCAVVGLEGAIVEVEVDISSGLPAFTNVLTQCFRASLTHRRICDATLLTKLH